MIYFDTCYMLKCYLPEHGHLEVSDLWRRSEEVVCCEFSKAEFASALHRHLREGRISPEGLTEVLAAWREDQAAGLWRWLPLDGLVINAVVDSFERLPANIFLRSADAVHLTCAREHGLSQVHSNDRHLKLAAPHFGLVACDVIS